MNTNQSAKKNKDLLHIILQKDNDLDTAEGRGNERIKRMTWTSAAAMFAQILQMAIPLITIRITLRYMGLEVYALWTTINSLFSLMTYADMGLGNGLQTKLSQETGKKEGFNGQVVVSSTYFVLASIAIVLGIILCILFPLLNWADIVNADSAVMETLTAKIVLAIIIPKVISIPLSLVCRCQNAMQDGFISYIWQGISSVLSLVSIYITIALDLGSVAVILVSSSIPLVTYALNSLFYFTKRREICPKIKSISINESRLMLKLGFGFFVLSLLNAVGLNMDNYIVAKADALNSVTSFSVALRATQLLNVACTVFSAPLWSANGEALANGDIDWVRKTTRKMSMLSCVIVVIAAILLLTIGPFLFNLWLGYDIGIDRMLLLGLILMQFAYAFISPYFMVLNASGQVHIQIVLFAVFAPISIAAKYFICKILGVAMMPFAGFVLYILIVAIPVFLTVRKQLSFDRLL